MKNNKFQKIEETNQYFQKLVNLFVEELLIEFFHFLNIFLPFTRYS